MHPDRLASIVPMFGGGTSFVETLEAIVRFVEEAEPMTDRLVRWHCDPFARVSSATWVMRRVSYLENLDFLSEEWCSPLGNRDSNPFGFI
jgi:putative restriction endonuclease